RSALSGGILYTRKSQLSEEIISFVGTGKQSHITRKPSVRRENYSFIDRRPAMSVLAHAVDFARHRAPHTGSRPGPFRRLFRRLLRSRQRRAEQDIAIHLGLTGGRLTDEIERRMTERLIGSGGFRS